MNRLRALSRDYLLPLVIGALALRALIPMGFMPGNGFALSISAQLCLPAGDPSGDGTRTEQIELPGTAHAMQCEYCLSPIAGASCHAAAPHTGVARILEIPTALMDAPYSRFALDRAQIPRAPPSA